MSPETWTGLAAVAAATAGALGEKWRTGRKARNGNGDGRRNGDSAILKLYDDKRLAKLEHELLDADGYVRSRFHSQANDLQQVFTRVDLQGQAIDTLRETVDRVEGKVDGIGNQIADLRVELARGRG